MAQDGAVGRKIRLIKKEGLRGRQVSNEQAVAAAINMVAERKRKRRKMAHKRKKPKNQGHRTERRRKRRSEQESAEKQRPEGASEARTRDEALETIRRSNFHKGG